MSRNLPVKQPRDLRSFSGRSSTRGFVELDLSGGDREEQEAQGCHVLAPPGQVRLFMELVNAEVPPPPESNFWILQHYSYGVLVALAMVESWPIVPKLADCRAWLPRERLLPPFASASLAIQSQRCVFASSRSSYSSLSIHIFQFRSPSLPPLSRRCRSTSARCWTPLSSRLSPSNHRSHSISNTTTTNNNDNTNTNDNDHNDTDNKLYNYTITYSYNYTVV